MAKDQTRPPSSVKQSSYTELHSDDHLAQARELLRQAELARNDQIQALDWARQDFESLTRDLVEQYRNTMRVLERVGALGERYREHAENASHKLGLLKSDYASLAPDPVEESGVRESLALYAVPSTYRALS